MVIPAKQKSPTVCVNRVATGRQKENYLHLVTAGDAVEQKKKEIFRAAIQHAGRNMRRQGWRSCNKIYPVNQLYLHL
ncbi:hypothetical protein JW935_13625 [candidate division KSB1 bacterium]|nr:hypothetical protein [candidate division KSB1 bacterium]